MNTMGQDREYPDEEIKEALRTVRDYISTWEDTERKNLEKDVNRRIENVVQDKNYRELGFELQDQNELEKELEEMFAPKNDPSALGIG